MLINKYLYVICMFLKNLLCITIKKRFLEQLSISPKFNSIWNLFQHLYFRLRMVAEGEVVYRLTDVKTHNISKGDKKECVSN